MERVRHMCSGDTPRLQHPALQHHRNARESKAMFAFQVLDGRMDRLIDYAALMGANLACGVVAEPPISRMIHIDQNTQKAETQIP